ncbi:hypothetical protein E2C01_099474 [Portunus trituberculatus]|uniref:Uncharacterized protein n=1 Tax=Portunus trituberculatus TaxID=210409 RepID=A0A5B7K9Q6_PORTR|nr:hypothetical protein [Portunus trituberculatus]
MTTIPPAPGEVTHSTFLPPSLHTRSGPHHTQTALLQPSPLQGPGGDGSGGEDFDPYWKIHPLFSLPPFSPSSFLPFLPASYRFHPSVTGR